MASRMRDSSATTAGDNAKRRAPPLDAAAADEVINLHLLLQSLPPPPIVDRVLLQRAFFINPERTKYVSVGFYPSQNSEPYLQLGGVRIRPINISERRDNIGGASPRHMSVHVQARSVRVVTDCSD